MRYDYERVALCTRPKCSHGPSAHKGIMRGDNDWRGFQEVGECRKCFCEGYDPRWEDNNASVQ